MGKCLGNGTRTRTLADCARAQPDEEMEHLQPIGGKTNGNNE